MSIQLEPAYLHQPREVSIETLALCNARCTFCPYPTLERKGMEMSLGLIAKMIAEMSAWEAPFFISPFKVNEPLLDHRLRDICRQIVKDVRQAKLRIFTNGSPLVASQIDWIQELPLGRVEHLWVSLNSLDAAEYESIMGLELERTVRRLDDLHERLIERTFPHRVVVSRVISTERNRWFEDTPGARADRAFFAEVAARWPMFGRFPIKRDGWLGYVEPSEDEVPSGPCGRWFELSITATGKAALCCMDGEAKYSPGDVHESSLLDIYNQPSLLKMRNSKFRGGFEPCKRCTY